VQVTAALPQAQEAASRRGARASPHPRSPDLRSLNRTNSPGLLPRRQSSVFSYPDVRSRPVRDIAPSAATDGNIRQTRRRAAEHSRAAGAPARRDLGRQRAPQHPGRRRCPPRPASRRRHRGRSARCGRTSAGPARDLFAGPGDGLWRQLRRGSNLPAGFELPRSCPGAPAGRLQRGRQQQPAAHPHRRAFGHQAR
jgi:hypothetical protein